MNSGFELHRGDKFVNIHGHNIPTFKIDQNEEVCFLSDLKHTAAGIYRKSQYEKLSTLKKEYDSGFIEHMLDAAKTYMLTNQISFSHDQIMKSIENSKQILNGVKNSKPEKSSFLSERTVKAVDDEIRVCVSSTPKDPQSSASSKKQSPVVKKTYPKKEKKSPRRRLDGGDNISESSFESIPKQEDVPTLRPPKKKIVYNVVPDECEVFVTHIDKPNCCWVREKAWNAQMEEVHRKVNEEAKYQPAVPKSKREMDTVYIAEDEGHWYRCKIMRFTPLTVLFVDYGNFAEVNEVKRISEEVANLPFMAIRITFKESEYIPCLEDEIRIKRFMKNQDGTFFVNVLQNNLDLEVAGITQKLQKAKIKQVDEDKPFLKKPPPLSSLKDNQKVVIAHEKDGVFYLRSEECIRALRKVEKEIDEYVKKARAVGKVQVNQLVLYQSNRDGKWYRAVVRKFDERRAEIELLDYVEVLMTDLKSLRMISERLSKEPVTYFVGGKLIGFEDTEFDNNCTKLIKEYVKTKKEFVVTLGFDAELDLFDGTRLLSEQLPQSTPSPQKVPTLKPQGKIFLKDIKTLKPRFGVESYLIGNYKNKNELSVVPTDELQKHMDYILRSEIEDKEVYTPTVGEVCLCYYIDNWYRCLVTRVFEKEYEVLFLDFGNSEVIKKDCVRKADDKITEVPALALPSVLVNVPRHQNVEVFLRKMIIVGNIYNVDVKKVSDGKCHVEIPLVYDEIKL